MTLEEFKELPLKGSLLPISNHPTLPIHRKVRYMAFFDDFENENGPLPLDQQAMVIRVWVHHFVNNQPMLTPNMDREYRLRASNENKVNAQGFRTPEGQFGEYDFWTMALSNSQGDMYKLLQEQIWYADQNGDFNNIY